MSIRAVCPGCRTVCAFADHFAGKTVRCKNCAQTLVVGAEEVESSSDAAKENIPQPASLQQLRTRSEAIRSGESPTTSSGAVVPLRERDRTPIPTKEREEKAKSANDTDVQETIQEKARLPIPSVPRAERTSPPRRRPREPERDWPSPQRRVNRGKQFVLIAAAAVLVLLVGGGVVAALVWYFQSGASQSPNKMSALLVDVGGPWPQPEAINGPANIIVTVRVAGLADEFTRDAAYDKLEALLYSSGAKGTVLNFSSKGDRMTVVLAPVRDVKAFARQLDFGTVRGVDERVITIVAHKVDGPPFNADPATKALYRLKSTSVRRRAEGARALKDLRTQDRREEIVKALESLLNDSDPSVRQEAILALGVWGTKDSVPLLLKAMSDKDTRKSVIIALGLLKDERAAEPIAERLEDFFERKEAVVALHRIGPAAEQAVLARLSHPDGQVRMCACDILKVIGTKQSIAALAKVAAAKDFFVSPKAQEAILAINARK
ncbi:MAG: HEAT repeat domain-containing protein [Gemmataceae bacterium]